MNITTIQQWKQYYQDGFRFLPIGMKKQVEEFDLVNMLSQIKKDYSHYFVFESGRIGRYTYFGYDPIEWVSGKNYETKVFNRDGETTKFIGNPLKTLKRIMSQYNAPNLLNMPKFHGGAIGYLSYDMVRYFEQLPNLADDDINVPDLYFIVLDKLWIYDHHEKELLYLQYEIINNDEHLEELFNKKVNDVLFTWNKLLGIKDLNLKSKTKISEKLNINRQKDIITSFTKNDFETAIKKVQDYIASGDVFQVNLSIRQSKEINASGFDIYRHLREINPSPYMGFLHFPELQLVSSSPELLIEINDGIIQTRPIAGTRPRGENEVEDQRLAHELLGNEKEIAEHIMLVDLERNDLGRVCKFGSVHVNELMVIEKYSHVMHIVSNIIGEVDEKNDIYDCIKATFPGGTITGAPKIRTMEIIEELEPVKRGPYTGSMGWIGFNENLELNILIRTLLLKENRGYIQAGAGIVIDSVPENEFNESIRKAEAVWKAVNVAEQELTT